MDMETLIADLEQTGLRIISWQDARTLIRDAQRQPEQTGLFGFFSIGFLIAVGLSVLAQAIYAVLSFRKRYIQFGTMRAIGLSWGQLAISLVSELALIVIGGVAAGIFVGLLSSRVFIPFLQIGYQQADLVPPYVVLMAWDDIAKAVLAMLLASTVTSIGLVAFLSRIRVFETLKLGETLA
jgi:putative ABC transport system permease protein